MGQLGYSEDGDWTEAKDEAGRAHVVALEKWK